MLDRRIDAIVLGIAYNHPAIREMENGIPLTMLDVGQKVSAKVANDFGGQACTIKANEHKFISEDKTSVCVGAVVVVNKSMADAGSLQHRQGLAGEPRRLQKRASPAEERDHAEDGCGDGRGAANIRARPRHSRKLGCCSIPLPSAAGGGVAVRAAPPVRFHVILTREAAFMARNILLDPGIWFSVGCRRRPVGWIGWLIPPFAVARRRLRDPRGDLHHHRPMGAHRRVLWQA